MISLPVLAAFTLAFLVLSTYLPVTSALGVILAACLGLWLPYRRARRKYDLANNPLSGLLKRRRLVHDWDLVEVSDDDPLQD
jgi:hypothetical protein